MSDSLWDIFWEDTRELFGLITEQGRRQRWPHLYAARDAKDKARSWGAVMSDNSIGHQLAYPYCQFCTSCANPTSPPCLLCYPWMKGAAR